MAGEHEVKRKISDDITLDCNFDLGDFPAILSSNSSDNGHILLTEKELYKLMEEIADRFDMDIFPRGI